MQLTGRERETTLLKQLLDSNKPEFLALISANGVKKNSYTEDMINGVVTLDDFFK